MAAALVGKDGQSVAILLTLKDGTDAAPVPRVVARVPAAQAAEAARMLAGAEAEDADGNGIPAARRVYSGGDEADAAEAAAFYLADLRVDAKGRVGLLAVPAPEAPRAEAALLAAAKEAGIEARALSAPVSAYDRVSALVAGLPRRVDGESYISGSKAVSGIIGKLLIADLSLLFPLVVAIIALVLFLSFRTARGVLLPLGNVVLSVVWAMGLMGWLGQAITMATMILPIILIAVGTAYTIHVINRYYEELSKAAGKKEAVEAALAGVAVPVLLAGVTTVIGFASLATSSIGAMRMFGILSALGILFALVLSLTLTPALMVLLPAPKAAVRGGAAKSGDRLSSLLAAVGRGVARRPVPVAAASIALILGIGIFAPRVTFESNTLESFSKDSEIRRSSEYLNENFMGITVMTVVVRTEEDGAVLDGPVVRAMDGLQADLEKLRVAGDRVVAPGEAGWEGGKPIVGGSQSIATFVRGVNKAVHADDPAFDVVPPDLTEVPVETERYVLDGKVLRELDADTGEELAAYDEGSDFELNAGYALLAAGGAERRVDTASGRAVELVPARAYIGQLVFQYENSGDPENIEAFVDNPRRTARVNVFVKTSSSALLSQVQAYTRARIAATFPEGARADITGLSNLTLAIMRLLVSTQVSSVLASFAICFLFIALMTRNPVEGLFSIVPLTGALAINFGFMGLFRIPIDISTATIASIGIGIGIDYTLHFIERLKAMRATMDLPRAVEATMATTGKGIFVNALAVAGGFAALLFSQVRGNVFMGLLMALIMLTSSIFAVTLLPALIVVFKPSFIERKAKSDSTRISA